MTTPLPNLQPLPWHQTADIALRTGRMLLLVGGYGAGKTSWALDRAQRQGGQPAVQIQSSPEMLREDLWGHYTLESAGSMFTEGPLPRAVREGRMLIIEEFNLMPLATRSYLLTLREASVLHHPMPGQAPVPVHPAFRLIATSNEESITCRHDRAIYQALIDGMLVIETGAMDRQTIRTVISQRFPQVEEMVADLALDMWDFYRSVADDALKDDDGITLGIRSMLHFIELQQAGMPIEDAVRIAFVNPYIGHSKAHEVAKMEHSLGRGWLDFEQPV